MNLITHMSREDYDPSEPCPKCGASSYPGGYCFGCGTYHPSTREAEGQQEDVATFIEQSFNHQMKVFLEGDRPPEAPEEKGEKLLCDNEEYEDLGLANDNNE